MWFQVHCPPLVGVLPTFRSRYLFAIGHQGVLSLAGWAPQIQTRFHVSGLTQVPDRKLSPFAYGTITRSGQTFQTVRLGSTIHVAVLQPHREFPRGLGWSAFARRY